MIRHCIFLFGILNPLKWLTNSSRIHPSLKEAYYVRQQLKTANCGELSNDAISLLNEKAKKEYQAVKLFIENGDHSFIIFTNIWDKAYNNTVFCDPYSGNVGKYDYENGKKYFGDFRRIFINKHSPVNFITSFNMNYHHIKIERAYNILPNENIRYNNSRLKFFNKKIKAILKKEEKVFGKRLVME